MVFYFTATGNSLYVAKQLDEERLSIPQEMNRENRHYKAERIGIVCPLFEFEIPPLVQAERTQAWLQSIGKAADYVNTIIMHDNALIVFDMDQQRSVEAEKQVDAHIDAIRSDIAAKRVMVQQAPADEIDFYQNFVAWIKKTGPMYAFPLYTVSESCVGCGTCTRVCPRGCIHLENKRPVWDYSRCANCMACIQACPTKAIQFITVKEPNPDARYRNPHIALKEIIQANRQD